MKLDAIRPLYAEHARPFASVYISAERTGEDAATQIALHWRRLRELLERAGADARTVEAIGTRLIPREEAAPGRAMFGIDGEVVYDEAFPHPPRREIARCSPLPHLMPLLAQRGETVPHLRVIADHTGADVITVGADVSRQRTVQVEEWPMQKTGVGGWSQRRYERGVEETWERNAVAVAEAVDREVRRTGAELVVVAGDPRSRALVRDHLGAASADRLVMAEHGSRGAGAAVAPFEADAEAAVDSWLERRRTELIERYGAGPAATGLRETVRALRLNRVDTLLIADDPSSDVTLWIGPEGDQLSMDGQELVGWGVAEPLEERADAAMVRAAAMTSAELWFVDRDALGTGVAALLRY